MTVTAENIVTSNSMPMFDILQPRMEIGEHGV